MSKKKLDFFQPQVPLRLPCYNLRLVSPLKWRVLKRLARKEEHLRDLSSVKVTFQPVMGGVCKLPEPVQPSILFSVYLRFRLPIPKFQRIFRTTISLKECFVLKRAKSLVSLSLSDASSPLHKDHDDLPSDLLPLFWL